MKRAEIVNNVLYSLDMYAKSETYKQRLTWLGFATSILEGYFESTRNSKQLKRVRRIKKILEDIHLGLNWDLYERYRFKDPNTLTREEHYTFTVITFRLDEIANEILRIMVTEGLTDSSFAKAEPRYKPAQSNK